MTPLPTRCFQHRALGPRTLPCSAVWTRFLPSLPGPPEPLGPLPKVPPLSIHSSGRSCLLPGKWTQEADWRRKNAELRETRVVLKIPGHGDRGQSQRPSRALHCSGPREGQGRVWAQYKRWYRLRSLRSWGGKRGISCEWQLKTTRGLLPKGLSAVTERAPTAEQDATAPGLWSQKAQSHHMEDVETLCAGRPFAPAGLSLLWPGALDDTGQCLGTQKALTLPPGGKGLTAHLPTCLSQSGNRTSYGS